MKVAAIKTTHLLITRDSIIIVANILKISGFEFAFINMGLAFGSHESSIITSASLVMYKRRGLTNDGAWSMATHTYQLFQLRD